MTATICVARPLVFPKQRWVASSLLDVATSSRALGVILAMHFLNPCKRSASIPQELSASSQGPNRTMSDGDWVCLQLPRRGNNWLVMQSRAEAHPNRQLYMFPDAATGWDVYFISFGECQIVQMQEFDILKLCSEDNWWPYCSYCGKFRENAHVVAYRRWRMAGKVGDRSMCLLHRRTRMATRSLLAPCTVWNRRCGCLGWLPCGQLAWRQR